MCRSFSLSAMALITVFAFGTIVGTTRAQSSPTGLISQVAAENNGLQRAWYTRVPIDSSRSAIASMHQHINSEKTFTVYEIPHDRGLAWVSERQLGRRGKLLGKDGARRMADIENLRYKALGWNPGETKLHEIPEIRIYVQSDDSVIHALDAHSGQRLWSAAIGNRKLVNQPVAANNTHVAVINGTTLYVLEAETGRISWEKNLPGVSSAGLAVTPEVIFVPMQNGVMKAFPIDPSDKTLKQTLHGSVGEMVAAPTVSLYDVSWATNRGDLVSSPLHTARPIFWLETDDEIVASTAFFSPNQIVAVSRNGFVHNVNATSGVKTWRFSTGEAMSQRPVIVDEKVYVITEADGLHQLAMNTGRQRWFHQGIDSLLGVSKDRVYASDGRGQMVVLEVETGARLATMSINGLDLLMPNWQTDRLFIGTRGGLIHCLHQTGQKWPTLHNPLHLPTADTSASDATEPAGDALGEDTDATADDDPFGDFE